MRLKEHLIPEDAYLDNPQTEAKACAEIDQALCVTSIQFVGQLMLFLAGCFLLSLALLLIQPFAHYLFGRTITKSAFMLWLEARYNRMLVLTNSPLANSTSELHNH